MHGEIVSHTKSDSHRGGQETGLRGGQIELHRRMGVVYERMPHTTVTRSGVHMSKKQSKRGVTQSYYPVWHMIRMAILFHRWQASRRPVQPHGQPAKAAVLSMVAAHVVAPLSREH